MINSYIALDLETTGLNPKYDKIIEIGALKIKEGQVINVYSTFIDVGIPISGEITKLTGITNSMVEGGIKLQKAIEEVVEFCEDYILLGHNILYKNLGRAPLFDYSFIKRNAVNHNLKFEKTGIDTLKIARKLLPHLEKRTLGYLCEHYQIETQNRHRAFDDAKAANDLYKNMFQEFGEHNVEVFMPAQLVYQVKKEGPITESQKTYLKDLMKYHKIRVDYRIEDLTKNEASRIIDKIILNYGKIIKKF